MSIVYIFKISNIIILMSFVKNKSKGFTLLELLIVIGIIGFISTISIFSMRTWSDTKYLIRQSSVLKTF